MGKMKCSLTHFQMIKLQTGPNSKGLQTTILSHAQMVRFVFYQKENIVGNGENAGNQHFVLFPQCFQKVSSSESMKIWDCFETRISFPHNPDFS